MIRKFGNRTTDETGAEVPPVRERRQYPFGSSESMVRWFYGIGQVLMGQIRALDYECMGGDRDAWKLEDLQERFALACKAIYEAGYERLLRLAYGDGLSDAQLGEMLGIGTFAADRLRHRALAFVRAEGQRLELLPEDA